MALREFCDRCDHEFKTPEERRYAIEIWHPAPPGEIFPLEAAEYHTVCTRCLAVVRNTLGPVR